RNVKITGTYLLVPVTVSFNGVRSNGVNVNGPNSLIATVPAGATSGPITVTTSGGSATSQSIFTVTGGGSSAPTIASFAPTSGPVGTSVTITGTGFTGTREVKFNGIGASFNIASDTSLTAIVPAGATTGPISVATPGGSAISQSIFTVTGGGSGTPTIASFAPTSGPGATSGRVRRTIL